MSPGDTTPCVNGDRAAQMDKVAWFYEVYASATL